MFSELCYRGGKQKKNKAGDGYCGVPTTGISVPVALPRTVMLVCSSPNNQTGTADLARGGSGDEEKHRGRLLWGAGGGDFFPSAPFSSSTTADW